MNGFIDVENSKIIDKKTFPKIVEKQSSRFVILTHIDKK